MATRENARARRTSTSRRRPRLLLPFAISSILILYTVLLCAAVWSYSVLRIRSDYRDTLAAERDRLRSAAITLDTQISAVLGNGIGAALAGANELNGGIDSASPERLAQTLANMLTGGDYVRGLFLASAHHFTLVTRGPQTQSTPRAPAWLRVPPGSGATWVGAPFPDPDGSGIAVVPIAHRLGRDAWAGALFDLHPIAQAYEQPDSDSGAGLFTTDGTALMLIARPANRSRVAGWLASNVGDSSAFQRLRSSATGLFEDALPYTGEDSFIAYDRVPGYSLIVAVQRTRHATLASWRAQRQETLVLAGTLTAMVIVMTALLAYFLHSLRRREMHYRTLFNHAAFGAFILEGDRIIEANDTSAAIFGVEHPGALVGLSPWGLSPTRQPDGSQSLTVARERMEASILAGARSFEWLHQRLDDGRAFYASVDLSSLQSRGKTYTLAIVHDISQRKYSEQERERVVSELRELAGALVHAQDDERRRIGRDLHDATGQVLASLELKLERLARLGAGSVPALRPLLDDCVSLAHRCAAEIRTASYLLHPPLLDEIGLTSALRWLADGLRDRGGLEVHLELPDSMERLPREQELAVFRVAQEALTNVRRHAMSPRVTIRLFETAEALVLEIEDSGRGMRTGAGTPSERLAGGVGLAGMAERMRQLGGSLSVRSSASGTCVRAELPLARAAEAAADAAG